MSRSNTKGSRKGRKVNGEVSAAAAQGPARTGVAVSYSGSGYHESRSYGKRDRRAAKADIGRGVVNMAQTAQDVARGVAEATDIAQAWVDYAREGHQAFVRRYVEARVWEKIGYIRRVHGGNGGQAPVIHAQMLAYIEALGTLAEDARVQEAATA